MLLCTGFLIHAQNLVPNPGFETTISCPPSYTAICSGFAPPWLCGNSATSDLFNECSPPFVVGVPDNGFGSQAAFEGDGYAGIMARFITANYREYLQVQLLSPLVAGTWYNVSFYVSLADAGCGSDHMGAYFSVVDPFQNMWTTLDYDAQIEYDNGYLSDATGWTLITGCFQAEGGETYMVIGNFHGDAETSIDPNCGATTSYYYVDGVSVEEGIAPEEILFDLGDPVFACYEYEIDPDLPGYYYHWEDGSLGPTLTVTESGTYSLTITDGCNEGIDSVEVTIAGSNPPVDVGPDEAIICNGDDYTISLDPDISEYTWNDGTISPQYTITTTGTYSVTLDDGCAVSSDEITVTVLDPPAPLNLGDDADLCLGESIDFAFDPSLGDFLWQDGNTGSSYSIDIGGTYSLTISNPCGEESDEIIISDLDIPEFNLGPDSDILCTGEILDIELDPALGDILWQDGSDAANYTISTPGIYIAYITNMCGTGSDQIEVLYFDDPVFNLGPDTQLCNGDTLLLEPGSIDGTYLWQDNSSTQTFTVDQQGTYSLLVSNFCGEFIDSIVVTYGVPITPPDLGMDFSLCPGETAVLNVFSAGANYLWQDASTADTLLVNAAGTYHVQVYDACSSFSDTVIVLLNGNPPMVDLPTQQTLCQGQSLILDAVVSGVSYLWNDNSQNQQLTVNAPGTYSVTVSNACGSDRDTITVLDGGPAPAVSLGTDINICPGESVTLSPVFSNVDSWLWQDGSVLPSYTVSAPGVISVEVSNACSTTFDTLNVGLLPATPPLDLGADTSLCSGQSFSLSINTPNVNILWPDGSTGTAYTVTGPGQVYASVSNSCGLSADTIEVSALPDIPDLNLGADQSLCPGELITISPGAPNVQYSWQDGSTGSSFQTTQQTTVILTITNECGTSTDTLEIIESTQGPQVNLGADIQVCAGEVVTIPSGISGVTYAWQDGSTNPSYTTSQSGIFILDVSNNCGSDSDTIVVDISGVAPVVDLGIDTTLCEGITLQLSSNADAITTIQWQDGTSSPTYTVTSPGMYSLAESNRCGDDQDTITITYLDAPDPFTLGADTTLCPGESLLLNAPSVAYDILWQDGSDGSTFIADQAGTYSLQLSNDCGVVSDNLVLNYDTRIPQLNPDTTIPWCTGDIFSLDATQPFVATYLWSNGAVTPSITVTSPGLYSINVSTPCTTASQNFDVVPGTDCEVIEVHQEIYIPNVFSPNGDGINDLFNVSFSSDVEVTSMQGSIYDRWGNLVFNSTVIPFLWDGQFVDESVMPGVYVYLIMVTYTVNSKEHERVFTGDVTVLR
ncbi:MAG: gliding motility-associated C-terminal domain-containing protein [Saprospiraceae bacterium]|nr:gliding motility-associated C-terminal domain-containing protein [Candidatus Opimibacter iunctus]